MFQPGSCNKTYLLTYAFSYLTIHYACYWRTVTEGTPKAQSMCMKQIINMVAFEECSMVKANIMAEKKVIGGL